MNNVPDTAALQKQNEILQSTLESFKDVLICSIDKNYRCLAFNQAFVKATEQAYGTVVQLDQNLLDFVTSEADRAKIKRNCDRALTGQAHTILESYGERLRHHFEVRFNPIINAAGSIEGITILSADVSERKQAEERLLLLNSELENFSYSVTHDLRAPLRSINGYASILLEDFSATLDEEGKRTVHVICSNAEKMNRLIDDLLAFSRLGRKDLIPEQVDMILLVKNVIEELSIKYPNARDVIRLKALPGAQGDRSLLRLAWMELLTNALKYSRKNSLPEIEVGSVETPGEIQYYVKDNGVGFDMNYKDKLFNMFQRLHSEQEFEGTGVGLASVHKIMKRHGGRTWADGKPGQGAQFYFALPVPVQ